MRKVPQKSTSAELAVRKLLYSLGYRYRIHQRDLPGTPDIVFKKKKKVIFVHGCFWHGHEDCPKARLPKSNIEYWAKKISNNIERDLKTTKSLSDLGWKVLIVWQCEIKDTTELTKELMSFLDDTPA